ncbi:S8 family peptidase [Niallia sp. Krafla_26]
MSISEKQVGLIPFKVKSVMQKATEIPPGVSLINAPQVWENNEGENVVIAVIDTGIDRNHVDLQKSVIGGYNFTTKDTANYGDDNGHGTHVAGVIAAQQNEQGVVGVAPKANLLILKALDQNGAGDLSWIINAIEYAISWRGPNNERVRVISMSLGGPHNEEEHKAIQKAVANHILVICAAGNEGDGDHRSNEFSYPASYPEVISVGAVDYDFQPAYFSNTNPEVDLVAPGVDILSTYVQSRYAVLSGTSMAAPHVSGAAALILNKAEKEFGRELTEPELYAQLIKHTKTLNFDRRFQGNGVLDLLAVPSPDPIADEPDPQPEQPIGGEISLTVNGVDKFDVSSKEDGKLFIRWGSQSQ